MKNIVPNFNLSIEEKKNQEITSYKFLAHKKKKKKKIKPDNWKDDLD